MKNIYFFLVIFFFIFQDLMSQKNVTGRLDFNIGFHYISDIQLNKILETENLPEVNLINNYIGFNLDVYYKKFIFSPEFGILNSQSKKNDYRTNLSGLVATVGLGYNFLKTSDISVSLLGFFSSIPTEVTLTYDKSNLDFNTIDPKVNSGVVRLNFVPINFGINLRSDFFSDKNFPVGISLSYEIGINRSEVKSYYATVLNPIKEKGDRISVKLSVPLKRY